MAKQVILKRLTLTNFKGMRNKALDFSGGVTTITGKNGTGKTTIIDAFNWLLFGKDSVGNSEQKFGIKTTGADGNFLPHLEHEVSGVFEVTDTETGEVVTNTFRRVLVEEWKETVNEEGESREYLKGHHTNYYYNEMPLKTKTEYDKQVTGLIPEEVFKVITNPSYFLTLHWERQREILLQMAGEITDAEIIASDAQFSKLLELLQGKTILGFQNRIKEDKAKLEDDLKRIPTRIDEVTRNLPQNIDFAAAEARLKKLSEEYAQIDKAIISAAEANRQAYEHKSQIQQKINQLRIEQKEVVFKAQQAENEEAARKNLALTEAQREYESLNRVSQQNAQTYKANRSRLETEKSIAASRKESYEKQTDTLRAKWYKVNAEEFKGSEEGVICPLFKHVCADSSALSQYYEDQQKAAEKFAADKEQQLKQINEDGAKYAALAKEQKEEVERIEAELTELEAKETAEAAELSKKMDAARQKAAANPKQEPKQITAESLPEWQSLQQQIQQLSDSMNDEPQQETSASSRTEELRQQRADIQTKMDEVKAELNTRDQIKKGELRIEELNAQKKQLQALKAKLQGEEDLIEAFERAKMDEVERRVNALFTRVQFRMFRTQIEEEKKVADCIAYIDGVKYSDKNKAGKINAGLDVINTLSAFHKVSAPILIDNAESVNEFIPVNSQLIKLVVVPEGNLTIKNE